MYVPCPYINKRVIILPNDYIIIMNYCNKTGEVNLIYYQNQDHKEFIFLSSLIYYNLKINKLKKALYLS